MTRYSPGRSSDAVVGPGVSWIVARFPRRGIPTSKRSPRALDLQQRGDGVDKPSSADLFVWLSLQVLVVIRVLELHGDASIPSRRRARRVIAAGGSAGAICWAIGDALLVERLGWAELSSPRSCGGVSAVRAARCGGHAPRAGRALAARDQRDRRQRVRGVGLMVRSTYCGDGGQVVLYAIVSTFSI